MRAIILAAGKGERLGDITQVTPKPMIKVNGRPILEYNIDLCQKFGITDIYINVHHLGSQIIDYFGDGTKYNVKITYSIENSLTGTSGAVRKIAEKYWNLTIDNGVYNKSQENVNLFSESFFVIYGDNLSNYNLMGVQQKALETKAIATIGFHYREDVTSSGVAEFDDHGKISSFIEKPRLGETQSHWVNAGIYFLTHDILKYIPKGESDFARTIFPSLLRKKIPIYGVTENTEVKAFDTIEMLNKNTK